MKKRVIAILLCVIMLVPFLVIHASATSAQEALDWINSQIGKSIDVDGVPSGDVYQCVDFVHAYCRDLFGWSPRGNARDYRTISIPSGWTRTQQYSGYVPSPGDIVIYIPGWTDGVSSVSAYGHVGVIVSANSSSFVIAHQNANGKKYVHTQVSNGYSHVWGYIRPPFSSVSNSVTFNSLRIENLGQTDAEACVEVSYTGTCPSAVGLVFAGDSGCGYYVGEDNIIWTGTRTGRYKFSDYGKILSPGTKYYYRFFVYQNGETKYSEVKTFTTPGTAKAPVMDLSTNSAYTGTKIRASWNHTVGAASYMIGVWRDGERIMLENIGYTNYYDLTFYDPGVYQVRVSMVDSCENATATSEFRTFELYNAPSTVSFSNPRATNVTETNAVMCVDVSYTGTCPSAVGLVFAGDSGCGYYVGEDNITWTGTRTGKYKFSDYGKTLSPGTKYYYRFFVYQNGETKYSEVKTFTTPGTAKAPALDLSTNSAYTGTKIRVSWNHTVGAASYFLWVLRDGENIILENVGYTNYYDLTFYDPGVYQVRVSMVDSCENATATSEYVSFELSDKHTHSYTSSVKAPTCTTQGYTIHTCSCGNSYIDSYTAALGHNYVVAVTSPTCTKQGYTKHTCSRCGNNYADNYVPALGHDFGADGKSDKCLVCGAKNPDCKAPVIPVEFEDVPKGAYYEDAVSWAVANGVTQGISATKFGPDNGCTRGQVVTFLWRAAGEPAPKSQNNPFGDVNAGDYYYTAVLWAVENGVTAGTSATTFSPDSTCTRGQIVTFLYRANGSPAPKSSANPFGDVLSGDYFYSAVLWAVENKITSGTSATAFSPDSTCTRAQVVTFLYRATTK